jgi:hypothetical protein
MAAKAAPQVVLGTPFVVPATEPTEGRARTRSRVADPSQLSKLNRGSFYANALPTAVLKKGADGAKGSSSGLPNAVLVGETSSAHCGPIGVRSAA